jgi:hypothetical protein
MKQNEKLFIIIATLSCTLSWEKWACVYTDDEKSFCWDEKKIFSTHMMMHRVLLIFIIIYRDVKKWM